MRSSRGLRLLPVQRIQVGNLSRYRSDSSNAFMVRAAFKLGSVAARELLKMHAEGSITRRQLMIGLMCCGEFGSFKCVKRVALF